MINRLKDKLQNLSKLHFLKTHIFIKAHCTKLPKLSCELFEQRFIIIILVGNTITLLIDLHSNEVHPCEIGKTS